MNKGLSRKALWTIVILVGGYILCQIIADIGATKMVQVGSYVLPGGTFIFAVTFTLRDIVHKKLGKEWARAAIVMAGVFNIVLALYLSLIARIPAPVFFGLAEAWDSIFAIVPSIVIGSIAAEVVSELVDTEVYHFVKVRMTDWPQWTRVLISNAISLPLDSFIFATLAFVLLPRIFGGEPAPFVVALQLMTGQIVWKALVTVVSLPGIYLVSEEPIV